MTDFSTEVTMIGSGGGGVSSGPERSFDIKRFLRLRLLPMIIIGTIIAVPGVAAVWLLVPVQYTATAQILYAVDTPSHIDSNTQLNERQLQRFFNDQVNMISSATILSRVKVDPIVSQIPWVAEAGNDLSALRDTVHARIVPGSNIMEITVTTDSSENAMSIVKAVSDEYRAEASSRNREDSNLALASLRQSRVEKEAELDNLDRELQDLYNALDAPIGVDGIPRSPEMQSYTDNLAQAKQKRLMAKTAETRLARELEEIKGYRQQLEERPDDPLLVRGIESRVSADAAVQQLNNAVITSEAEIAVLSERYRSDAKVSTPLKAEQNALAATKRALKEKKREVRHNILENVIETVEMDLADAASMVSDAEGSIEEFEQAIDDNRQSELETNKKFAEIQRKKQEIENLNADIQSDRNQISRIMLESQAVARMLPAGPPEAPDSPDYGERIKFLLMVFAAACGIAGMYGVLREFTDQAVRTPQDVKAVTALPLLAAVPHSQDDRIPGGGTVPLLTAEHPISTTADEFRRILTRIIYPPEGAAELNTVLIASPSRGDGKTSMACNLAISLAQANRRVLLLDVSARHPSIETCFGFEPAEGLSEVLCGEAHPSELVRPTRYPNLSVLGPGFRQKQLVGKLASRETVEFLEQAEEAFEHVIIDSPPALLMSDAKLLAPVVDGVIVVCGVGKSTLGMMRRCLSDLAGIGANIVGIVLNGIRPQRGGYLAKNLTQYYQYSEHRGDSTTTPAEDFGDVGSAMPALAPPSRNGNGSGVGEEEEDLPTMILVDEQGSSDAAHDEGDVEAQG